MGILKAFLSSPSRNHLVISDDCIVGFDYIDVGLEKSAFIEDKISDRRLSMRVQDHLNVLLRSHICKSEEFGEYLALTNIGILFEPLLKIDLDGFLDRWSQNMILILDVKDMKDKEPVDVSGTDEGKAKNRRVTFSIYEQ